MTNTREKAKIVSRTHDYEEGDTTSNLKGSDPLSRGKNGMPQQLKADKKNFQIKINKNVMRKRK